MEEEKTKLTDSELLRIIESDRTEENMLKVMNHLEWNSEQRDLYDSLKRFGWFNKDQFQLKITPHL